MTIAIVIGIICAACALGGGITLMLLRSGAKHDQQMDMSAEEKKDD